MVKRNKCFRVIVLNTSSDMLFTYCMICRKFLVATNREL
jgi:hypothetical protein